MNFVYASFSFNVVSVQPGKSWVIGNKLKLVMTTTMETCQNFNEQYPNLQFMPLTALKRFISLIR